MSSRRDLGRWERLVEGIAKSRAGGWFFVHVANRIDPLLLRASRGRLSLAVGRPVLLLQHTGARSGQPRATPLLYGRDGANIVLVASNAGSQRHPAWYHNVRAHPDVDLLVAGASGRYRARTARGAEHERLWRLMNDLYSGYDVYQDRAGGRGIPIVVCEPV